MRNGLRRTTASLRAKSRARRSDAAAKAGAAMHAHPLGSNAVGVLIFSWQIRIRKFLANSRGGGMRNGFLSELGDQTRVVIRRSQETTMADDLTNRGAQDRARISLNEDHEVRYWTKELGVSKERLASVIACRQFCRRGPARVRQVTPTRRPEAPGGLAPQRRSVGEADAIFSGAQSSAGTRRWMPSGACAAHGQLRPGRHPRKPMQARRDSEAAPNANAPSAGASVTVLCDPSAAYGTLTTSGHHQIPRPATRQNPRSPKWRSPPP